MEHALQKNTTTTITKKQGSFFGKRNDQPFFAPAFIQPKLTVAPADDAYEREADAVAAKVMRMDNKDTLQTKISPVNIQRKCAHCEEEEKEIQRKPDENMVQREPGDQAPADLKIPEDWGERSPAPPYMRLRLTIPPLAADNADSKINYGEANLELINRGIINPGDFTMAYRDLWKADYRLTTEWGLGTIVKNLYGLGEKIDAKALKPVRGVVKKIPILGPLLKDAIKFEAPTVKNGDWDKYLTDKLAVKGLGAGVSRDNPAYNSDSGFTITVNIVDTHFDENNIIKLFKKPASPESNSDIQRKCTSCSGEEKINRKETGNSQTNTAAVSVEQSLQSGGQSMDTATRAFMESRFGYDFGNVQIHNDTLAHQSSAGINALAYTHGNHVVFGAGKYQPETNNGKQLLAHELTHVLQQKNAGPALQRKGCGFVSTPEGLWADQHPGKVFSSGDKDKEPNEFIFWNFCVADIELRDEHKTALLAEMPRWNKLMNAKNGTRNDLKINITGTASSSGNAAQNVSLANDRADKVRDFLVANGIPANIIITSGTGSATPLANGGTPEDEARNRRVELFLFTPTQTSNIPGSLVAANVDHLTIGRIGKDPSPVFDPSKNIFARRIMGMKASADVDFMGLQGDQIGMIQFLTFDSRNAQYLSPQGDELTLDFEHCFTQLPCRDVADATSLFSFDDETLLLKNTGSESGKITMHDAPGTVFPLKYPKPGSGPFVLQRYSWAMGFDLIVGIRSGNAFMPLNSVTWGLGSTEDVDVKNKKTSGIGPFAVHGNWGTTSVIAKRTEINPAMSGKTCRLLARSMEFTPEEHPCRPNEIK
ncbi:MAG TPA: DUF4157 domain-containing protein [Chitinophagaceae bacterium]|nr:DUF4157 domain-containing protein [Chitinophagaceae bacterium]